ncbi:MAG: hypothetical protein HY820_43280 [Acidobacteria bacterium]|nr:hypothetical protein [Acidobacteriota bacterium]
MYEQLAQDWVNAYEGDAQALERLNAYYERGFTQSDLKAEIWRRVYAFRQRSSRVPKNYLQLSEAQLLLAQDAGFGNWEALLSAVASGEPPAGPLYEFDERDLQISPRRRLSNAEWDRVIDVMREHRVTAVEANGLMTDTVLKKIAALDHVTHLRLGGSRELSDDGLLELARMPQLQLLDLSEYPGGKLTDRGLGVLRHLPNLREFEMTWQSGISDAGVRNLAYCQQLERVNLMGSPTGDGAIEALQGKPRLRRFSTGRLTTDAGLRFLQNFPLMRRSSDPDAGATLLLDGPFSNEGLSSLAGLAGIQDLDLFWHVSEITADGFAHLVQLPNLQKLGCDGELSSDDAMVHIAAMPKLGRLRIQESVATEDGFVALSKSRSIESVWGRECPNFADRSLLAFANLPSLRGLGIGLGKVSDRALSALPRFPSLRELTPIGVQDSGFVHVGRCRLLERLTCMYCRDTTDVATGHIAGLSINYYYAGLTKITDRSLEILGSMDSLEQVEFYECLGIADAGLPFLAKLPKLREIHLDGLPHVTLAGASVFPAGVRVKHSH